MGLRLPFALQSFAVDRRPGSNSESFDLSLTSRPQPLRIASSPNDREIFPVKLLAGHAIRLFIGLTAGLILVQATIPAGTLASADIPLGHWSYEAIERLTALDIIDRAWLFRSPIAGNRPPPLWAEPSSASGPAISPLTAEKQSQSRCWNG